MGLLYYGRDGVGREKRRRRIACNSHIHHGPDPRSDQELLERINVLKLTWLSQLGIQTRERGSTHGTVNFFTVKQSSIVKVRLDRKISHRNGRCLLRRVYFAIQPRLPPNGRGSGKREKDDE